MTTNVEWWFINTGVKSATDLKFTDQKINLPTDKIGIFFRVKKFTIKSVLQVVMIYETESWAIK